MASSSSHARHTPPPTADASHREPPFLIHRSLYRVPPVALPIESPEGTSCEDRLSRYHEECPPTCGVVKNTGERLGCRNCSCRFGHQVPLEVRHLGGGLGRGLFYAGEKALRANAHVIEYAGEVVTREEMSLRQDAYRERDGQACPLYFFEVQAEPGTEDKGFVVDAMAYGNHSRYANHSCGPSCWVDRVRVDGVLRLSIRVGSEGLRGGDEITLDYGENFIEKGAFGVECLCGKPCCRLPPVGSGLSAQQQVQAAASTVVHEGLFRDLGFFKVPNLSGGATGVVLRQLNLQVWYEVQWRKKFPGFRLRHVDVDKLRFPDVKEFVSKSDWERFKDNRLAFRCLEKLRKFVEEVEGRCKDAVSLARVAQSLDKSLSPQQVVTVGDLRAFPRWGLQDKAHLLVLGDVFRDKGKLPKGHIPCFNFDDVAKAVLRARQERLADMPQASGK